MKTLPSSAYSGVAVGCAAAVVMRPLALLWNFSPVCMSRKQPVP
jgi:hypothetical protein